MTRDRTAYNSARRVAKAVTGHPAANDTFNLNLEPAATSLREQMEVLRSVIGLGEIAKDVRAFEAHLGARDDDTGFPILRLVGGNSRSNGSDSGGLTF